MKPEMTNLRGKARLLKPAMHHWHQIATTENAKSKLTTFKKSPLISIEHPSCNMLLAGKTTVRES